MTQQPNAALRYPSAESERAPRPKPMSSVPRGRILIVDDEPSFGQSLCLLLRRSHELTYTPSAREAMRWMQEGRRYDVILCDLMMAEMQGGQFHAELSQLSPELARRVIFITGGAYTRASMDFVARMTNPFLTKPFKLEELEKLLGPLLTAV
jgi:CheY-like chemotaxis protein